MCLELRPDLRSCTCRSKATNRHSVPRPRKRHPVTTPPSQGPIIVPSSDQLQGGVLTSLRAYPTQLASIESGASCYSLFRSAPHPQSYSVCLAQPEKLWQLSCFLGVRPPRRPL